MYFNQQATLAMKCCIHVQGQQDIGVFGDGSSWSVDDGSIVWDFLDAVNKPP